MLQAKCTGTSCYLNSWEAKARSHPFSNHGQSRKRPYFKSYLLCIHDVEQMCPASPWAAQGSEGTKTSDSLQPRFYWPSRHSLSSSLMWAAWQCGNSRTIAVYHILQSVLATERKRSAFNQQCTRRRRQSVEQKTQDHLGFVQHSSSARSA